MLPEDDVKRVYDKYAKIYETETEVGGYVAIHTATDVFNKSLGSDKKNIRILDVGCGTGMVGEHLRDLGYTNVDGLDLSQEMLNIALKKGVYKKSYCAPLVKDYNLPITDGEYDSIICVGTIGIGHVKADAFDEIIRLVKSGVSVDPKFGYLSKFAEMVKDKKWKLISEEVVKYFANSDYYPNRECALSVYEVL